MTSEWTTLRGQLTDDATTPLLLLRVAVKDPTVGYYLPDPYISLLRMQNGISDFTYLFTYLFLLCVSAARTEIRALAERRVNLHLHLSFNCGGRWGTTDDFTTTFLHFSLFSTALWDLANSRPVHSRMLSSHLFLCPPCLLPPFTVPVSYTHLTLPTS